MSKKKIIGLFLLSFAIAIIIGLPSSAADSVDILTSTRDNMNANRTWWTSLWELNYHSESTMSGTPSLSDMVFSQITQWFFALSLVAYLIILFMKMALLVNHGPSEILKSIYPFLISVILVTTLMVNNSANLKGVIFDLRTTMNTWPSLLLDANIVDSTPRQALADSLVTDRAQLKIASYLQQCKPLAPTGTVALPTDVLDPKVAGPMTLAAQQASAFRDCMKSVASVAQEELDKAEQDCGLFGNQVGTPAGEGCKLINRFTQKVVSSIDSVIKTEDEKLKTGTPSAIASLDSSTIGFLDFVAGMTANAASRPLLSASQWLYISFLELAMFLVGIGALINIPIALIPGRLNIAVGTLIAFLTLGLAQLMYIVTISVVALLLSHDQSVLFSDMRFPLALGVFAPIVSFLTVAVGGLAAANAFTGASFTAANTVVSAGASIIGNAGIAISRGSYGRR